MILIPVTMILVTLLAVAPTKNGPLTVKLQLYSPAVVVFTLSILNELQKVPLVGCAIVLDITILDLVQITDTLNPVSTAGCSLVLQYSVALDPSEYEEVIVDTTKGGTKQLHKHFVILVVKYLPLTVTFTISFPINSTTLSSTRVVQLYVPALDVFNGLSVRSTLSTGDVLV